MVTLDHYWTNMLNKKQVGAVPLPLLAAGLAWTADALRCRRQAEMHMHAADQPAGTLSVTRRERSPQ